MKKPKIIIDTREQLPLEFQEFETVIDGLPVGDYGLEGFSDWDAPDFIVERKSVSDLVGSLTKGRARFYREIQKMRQFNYAAIVIEGVEEDTRAGAYQSMTTPASIISSLDAISVRCNIHIFWCQHSFGAARKVENLAAMFLRGVEKRGRKVGMSFRKNKKETK